MCIVYGVNKVAIAILHYFCLPIARLIQEEKSCFKPKVLAQTVGNSKYEFDTKPSDFDLSASHKRLKQLVTAENNAQDKLEIHWKF